MNKSIIKIIVLWVFVIGIVVSLISLHNYLKREDEKWREFRRNTFATDLQSLYETATTQFISDSMGTITGEGVAYGRSNNNSCYGKSVNGYYNESGDVELKELDYYNSYPKLDYYIEFNLAGEVIKFFATDGEYQYAYYGDGLKRELLKVCESIRKNPDNLITPMIVTASKKTDEERIEILNQEPVQPVQLVDQDQLQEVILNYINQQVVKKKIKNERRGG